ncbi:MAG: peptidylprolyl isomerase [Treponema sp.]|nr:peptidylprolyl isomerase [Treponema sp.]
MAKKNKIAPAEKESAGTAISRKFKQSPGLYIGSVVVLVLITITFIGGDFLSGGGFGGSRGDLIFGYYDKVPIVMKEGNLFGQTYNQVYDNIRQQYQAQGIDITDPSFSSDTRRQIHASSVWQAYEQAVMHNVILHLVNKSKYTPSERTVDRAVAQQYMDHTGSLSPAYYRMTESARSAQWRQSQEELAKMMFIRDYFALLVPEAEARFIANMASPERSFDVVSFNIIEEFPESEYLAYARENAELFYSIHLSRITISSSEREARRVLASIRNETITFEEAARVHSQDGNAVRGGDMGSRYFFELNWEIPNAEDRDAVFKIGRGEVSDVIPIGDVWAIFRVEQEATPPNFFDNVLMERVRSYVRSVARGRMDNWAIERANDFIRDARVSGFDNAARLHNLEKQSFGPLPLNYSSVELFSTLETFGLTGSAANEISGLSRNERFWSLAFSAPLNTPTEPLIQGGHAFVFIPTQQTASNELELENIAMMYTNSWVPYLAEKIIKEYFLNSDKITDDNFFWDAFYRNIRW